MTHDPPRSPADHAGDLLVDRLVDELKMSRRAAQRFVDRTLPDVLDTASKPADRPADPDAPCPHLAFAPHVAVARVGEGDAGAGGRPRAYVATLTIQCEHCAERFRFMGVPAGFSYAAPSLSVDEFEINLPMRPSSADPDFGLGLPGFAIGIRVERTDPGGEL